jgi:hypothetical protein
MKKEKRRKLPLMFNQNTLCEELSDGAIKVECNYGEKALTVIDNIFSKMSLDDFYNRENNESFCSYCDDFQMTEDGDMTCGIVFYTIKGPRRVSIERKTLGELFDVLFCLQLAFGDPNKTGNETAFESFLTLFILLLNKEAKATKWTMLKKNATDFREVCAEAENAEEVAEYIKNKMCLKKPKNC